MLLSVPHQIRYRLASIPLFWVITFPLAVSAMGTLAGAGYLSHRHERIIVTTLGQQLVDQTNHLVHQELEDYLDAPLLINQLTADLIAQNRLNEGDSAALEALLAQRLQQFPSITGVVFASPAGQLRAVEHYPERQLVRAEPDDRGRVRVYRLGLDGALGAEREVAVGWQSLGIGRDRRWYEQAVASGTLGWHALPWQDGGEPLTLYASQPLYDPRDQTLLGVFGVYLRLEQLSALLRSLDVGQDGRLIITNANGMILATSSPDVAPERVSQGDTRRRLAAGTLMTSPDPIVRALGEVLQRESSLSMPQSAEATVLRFHHQGEPQLGSISAFQDAYGLDWRVITVMPEDRFLNPSIPHQRQALLLWLLGWVSAVGLGVVIAKLLLHRLGRYYQASQALAAGNLTQRLPTDSPISELNGLALAFNQMADQLQASFQTIQTALADSEAKFTTVFRASPNPIAIATLADGRIVEANRSFTDFFGRSREEMIGRTAVELNLWADANQRQWCRQQLVQQRRVRNLETRVRNATGDIRTVLLAAEVQLLGEEDHVILTFHDITNRQQAEAHLRQTEQWLCQYSQVAPSMIYTFVETPEGDYWFEYLSAAVEEISGITVEQGLRDANVVRGLIHPEDRKHYLTAEAHSAANLSAFSHQCRILTPAGEVKWIHTRSQPERRPNGVVAWHGVVVDLSTEKQVEAALRESEARFRQLAESVQEGFFVYETAADYYSYINPAYWAILGTDPKAGTDNLQKWLDGIHLDDRDRIDRALERERQGETFDQEYRYRTPAGELRWLRSKAFPLYDGQGEISRIVGTVENITDRKQAEAALRQSEERFRSIFNHAPYGMSLVLPTGQFVMANPYYCSLLGYSEAELRTLTFQDVTYPEDRNDDWAGFQRMMAGEIATYQVEKRYLSKQGEVLPVLINAAPVYDVDGHPLYSVGHVQDIRDRLAIDQMKDEFISIVSHELRTPITAIQGALALLGSGVYEGRPEKVKTMLTIAINNSDRLVRLVNDILSLERLTSGKVSLDKEPCHVPELMEQAIDSIQTIADRAAVQIVVQPVSVTLLAAPDAIIQTLTNLLSNAIKFSNAGGTVWLRATVEASTEDLNMQPLSDANWAGSLAQRSAATASPVVWPHPYLLFTVEDQGRGIPADKLDSIFEQFQQVDVSDSRQRGAPA